MKYLKNITPKEIRLICHLVTLHLWPEGRLNNASVDPPVF